MKRAFLIYGPESSGNRLMARILIAAGCIGDGGHYQRWEHKLLNGSPVVWLRSLPLGKDHRWPDPARHIQLCRNAGYTCHVLVMVRGLRAAMRSQVFRRHVSSEAEARENIRRAYSMIFEAIRQTEATFDVVSYESLILHPEAAGELVRELGLGPLRMTEEIRDENQKHYVNSA